MMEYIQEPIFVTNIDDITSILRTVGKERTYFIINRVLSDFRRIPFKYSASRIENGTTFFGAGFHRPNLHPTLTYLGLAVADPWPYLTFTKYSCCPRDSIQAATLNALFEAILAHDLPLNLEFALCDKKHRVKTFAPQNHLEFMYEHDPQLLY